MNEMADEGDAIDLPNKLKHKNDPVLPRKHWFNSNLIHSFANLTCTPISNIEENKAKNMTLYSPSHNKKNFCNKNEKILRKGKERNRFMGKVTISFNGSNHFCPAINRSQVTQQRSRDHMDVFELSDSD